MKMTCYVSEGALRYLNGFVARFGGKLDYDPFFTRGWWLKMVGFPKKDLDQYTIISSSHAKEAFETGVDAGLNLLD